MASECKIRLYKIRARLIKYEKELINNEGRIFKNQLATGYGYTLLKLDSIELL